MRPTARTRAWLQIHFCVVLWGFTAVLGKLITLPALSLVLYRMLLVTAALCVVPSFWRGVRALPPRSVATYSSIGLVVALHWLAFYGAIKLANASAAASCMALSPVFTALIEPRSVGRKLDVRDVLFGLAVVPGVVLVVGGTPTRMHLGIVVGLVSALFGAIFSVLNKRFIASASALAITGLEMAAGAVFIAAVGPLWVDVHALFALPSRQDAVLLIVLALGCTLLPFALWLVTLRELSAFSTSLAVNMEPVYAVLLAALLLNEQHQLRAQFYLGVVILVTTVLLYPMVTRRT